MDEENDCPHVGFVDVRIFSRIEARERRVLAACRSPIVSGKSKQSIFFAFLKMKPKVCFNMI